MQLEDLIGKHTLYGIGSGNLEIKSYNPFYFAFELDQEYGWGTFEDFKIMFDRQDWERSDIFKNSLFVRNGLYNDISKIHAAIYKFEGKGMLLNPITYYKSKIYIKNYIEEKEGTKKCVDWKKITNRGETNE